MTDSRELKPCPFCGDDPILERHNHYHRIKCCYASGWSYDKGALIRHWNNRPDIIGEIREWAKEELKLVEIFPEASVIVLFIKLERFLDKSEQEG